MSVLEALLPIASASLSPKEGSATLARRADPVSKESAVKPMEEGHQKKTPHNREEQKNAFARVLDDRLQIPETATSASHRPSEIENPTPADGSAGGMMLPLQGEALPPEQLELPIRNESSSEVSVEVVNAVVSQEDASELVLMNGQGEIIPSTEVPVAANALGVVESSSRDELDVNDTKQLSLVELPMQADVLPVTDTETAAQALTAKDVGTLVPQDTAQRVREWRGLSLNPQGERMSVLRGDGSPVQALPLAQGGQLQQFADSLRQAVNQELSAASGASERSSNVQAGTAEAMPWRADTAGTTGAASVRGTLVSGSFSQVLQSEVFGQPLGERVGNHAWGERLSQRVSLMLGQKISSAHIQLDPPELGAMSIKVSVHGDQASVSFHSAHAVVRDALEQSFPRLQEMLNQQGLQLADAQVSDRNASGQGSFAQSGNGAQGSVAQQDQDETQDNMQSRVVQLASGLIDFYA